MIIIVTIITIMDPMYRSHLDHPDHQIKTSHQHQHLDLDPGPDLELILELDLTLAQFRIVPLGPLIPRDDLSPPKGLIPQGEIMGPNRPGV